MAQGGHRLRTSLPALIEAAAKGLTCASRELFQELYQQLVWVDERLEGMHTKMLQVCAATEPCQRLMALEGVGPMMATALYAAVPQAHLFHHGRHRAAW